MSTINDRIALCVQHSGLTKTEFARRLNVTQQYVSSLCNGRKAPSDRTISDICREFNINESWLRTGSGEMLRYTARGTLAVLAEEYHLSSGAVALIRQFLDLTPEVQETLVDFALKVAEEVLPGKRTVRAEAPAVEERHMDPSASEALLEDSDLKKQAEAYYHRLLLEKKQELQTSVVKEYGVG